MTKKNEFQDVYVYGELLTDTGIFAQMERITPEVATKMLEKNHKKQREIKPALLKKYKKMIEENGWAENGEPIIFTKSGTLGNGAHRLNGVIETGIPINVLVVRGVEDEINGVDTFLTFDYANRTLEDALSIAGYKIEKSKLVKLIKINESFKTLKLNQKPNGVVLDKLEIVEKMKEYSEIEALDVINQASRYCKNSEFLFTWEGTQSKKDLLNISYWIGLTSIQDKIFKGREFLKELSNLNSDNISIQTLQKEMKKYASPEYGGAKFISARKWRIILKTYDSYIKQMDNTDLSVVKTMIYPVELLS